MSMDHFNYDSAAAPEGYHFNKKQMTEKAKGKLRAYWSALASQRSCQDDIDADRKAGRKVNYDWVNRYSNNADVCLWYLINNGFIGKDKK